MTLAIAYNRDQFYTVAAALGGLAALEEAAALLERAGTGGEGIAAIRGRLAGPGGEVAKLTVGMTAIPTPLVALRELVAGRGERWPG